MTPDSTFIFNVFYFDYVIMFLFIYLFIYLFILFIFYSENLKSGVQSGMIKSKSACEAGIKAFKDINNDVLIRGKIVYAVKESQV